MKQGASFASIKRIINKRKWQFKYEPTAPVVRPNYSVSRERDIRISQQQGLCIAIYVANAFFVVVHASLASIPVCCNIQIYYCKVTIQISHCVVTNYISLYRPVIQYALYREIWLIKLYGLLNFQYQFLSFVCVCVCVCARAREICRVFQEMKHKDVNSAMHVMILCGDNKI